MADPLYHNDYKVQYHQGACTPTCESRLKKGATVSQEKLHSLSVWRHPAAHQPTHDWLMQGPLTSRIRNTMIHCKSNLRFVTRSLSAV